MIRHWNSTFFEYNCYIVFSLKLTFCFDNWHDVFINWCRLQNKCCLENVSRKLAKICFNCLFYVLECLCQFHAWRNNLALFFHLSISLREIFLKHSNKSKQKQINLNSKGHISVFSLLFVSGWKMSFAFLWLSHGAKIRWVGYLTKITFLRQWKYKQWECWSFKDKLDSRTTGRDGSNYVPQSLSIYSNPK